ncbi:hypothetical protein AB0933_18765 [Streptomyces venezuelae]|uniref:hypothetical protein n=1 Tax=Streptomyces venezuelae TaxID=54571 RepID=UPI0034542129
MEAVDLVLAALAAGGTAAVGEAAALAVNGAHTALRERLRHLFSRHPSADAALDLFENDPEAFSAAVRQYLVETGAAGDSVVLRESEQILRLTDPSGFTSGRYRVDARGAQGVQVGDSNTQHNHFDAPPGGAG